MSIALLSLKSNFPVMSNRSEPVLGLDFNNSTSLASSLSAKGTGVPLTYVNGWVARRAMASSVAKYPPNALGSASSRFPYWPARRKPRIVLLVVLFFRIGPLIFPENRLYPYGSVSSEDSTSKEPVNADEGPFVVNEIKPPVTSPYLASIPPVITWSCSISDCGGAWRASTRIPSTI